MWKIMVADHQKSGSASKRGVPKRPSGELYVLHFQIDDFFKTKSCGKQEVVLVGSSMGGYVSMAVANEQPIAGLFLMAPALWMKSEEYIIQSYCPKTQHIEIVHGMHDDIVPYENSIRFAKEHDSTILHLVPDDHRLKASHDFLACQFQRFINDFSK